MACRNSWTRECSTIGRTSWRRVVYSEPPKTWEELKEMATKVVRDWGTRYGYVFQGAD